MKGMVIEGNVYGSARGPPTIEPLKEIWKIKLKKLGDHVTRVPLTMSNLTTKGKEDGSDASKKTRTLVLKLML